VNVAVGDVVKIKEVGVPIGEKKSYVNSNSFPYVKAKTYFAESTVLPFVQCSQSECTDVASSMIAFRDRVVLHGLRADPTCSGIVVLRSSTRIFCTTVVGSVTVGVVVVGVAGVSAASVLSAGAGSFCDFRRAGPLPLRPLDPRLPPPPPLRGLWLCSSSVLMVATEADIVQDRLK
jgi:hypothetical protein